MKQKGMESERDLIYHFPLPPSGVEVPMGPAPLTPVAAAGRFESTAVFDFGFFFGLELGLDLGLEVSFEL